MELDFLLGNTLYYANNYSCLLCNVLLTNHLRGTIRVIL